MRILFKILFGVVTISLVVTGGLWWVQRHEECFRVPLRQHFDSRYFYVDGAVGENACFLELSLGGNYEFLLSKKMIHSVSSTITGYRKFSREEDVECNEPLFQIPEISIGNFKVKNAISLQEEYDFSPDLPTSDLNRTYRIGEIGAKILERTNLLLDVHRRCLYFTRSPRQLKAKGYELNSWIVVPYQKEKGSIKIEIETDIGKKSFILMPGATHVFIKPSEISGDRVSSNKFIINGVDFGPTEMLSYELPKACPAEGVIGLSFLQNHAVYIDCSHQRLYIQK